MKRFFPCMLLATLLTGAGACAGNAQSSAGSGGSTSGEGGDPGAGGEASNNGGNSGQGGIVANNGGAPGGNGGGAGAGGVLSSGGVASNGGGSGNGGAGGASTTKDPCPPLASAENHVDVKTTDTYCFKTDYTIEGWTCWSMGGRTITVNGKDFTSCGGTPPAKVGAYNVFQISKGENANAGMTWWGKPGTGNPGGGGGTPGGGGGTPGGGGGTPGTGGVAGAGGQTSSTGCAVPASPNPGSGSFTNYYFGQGSYQEGGYYRMACGYRGKEPSGPASDAVENIATPGYFAAIPGQGGFDSKSMCGACVKVTNGGASKIFTIIDECPYGSDGNNPPCQANPKGHLDLSKAGFDGLGYSVGNPSSTNWQYVPCPVTGNVKIRLKPGNPNQVYIENVVLPLKSVTLNALPGTRLPYGAWTFNAFLAGGTLVMTDWGDRSITYVVPASATADTNVDTGLQFPACN